MAQNNQRNTCISEIIWEMGPKTTDRTTQVESKADQRGSGALQTQRVLSHSDS